MSRIGRSPIPVPGGVDVTVSADNHVVVKGPKGTLERDISPQLELVREDGTLLVKRPNDERIDSTIAGRSSR